MPFFYPCPYLNSDVELTDERLQHIGDQHEELADYFDKIGPMLQDPEQVRQSRRNPQSRLFYRWYDDLKHGKYVIVIVVTDESPADRNWIVTAYISRRATGGTLEWAKS